MNPQDAVGQRNEGEGKGLPGELEKLINISLKGRNTGSEEKGDQKTWLAWDVRQGVKQLKDTVDHLRQENPRMYSV